MISVRNLQLPLSGSKLIFIFLLSILGACSTSKKVATKGKDVQVVKSNSKPPTTKSTTKVDTVVWTKKNDLPPIVNEKEVEVKGHENGTELHDSYDAALFIPFKAGAYNTGTNTEERFVQYYAGVKLACQQLEKEGVNLNIDVFDSEDNSAPLHTKLSSSVDLIIGPYDESRLKPMIDYGKEHMVPVVSPWFALSKVADNPYYLQLRPTLKDHFTSIVKNISENFKSDDVVLVGRNTKGDKAWFSFLQDAAKAYYKSNDPTLFTEHFVLDDSLANGEWVFGDLINQGKKVFVVPNYSFKDENYIYSVLRRLNAEKYLNQIVVYGMPIMLDSDRIDFDYYNSLNMRLVVSEFVDERDSDVAAFGRKFYDSFSTIPEKDAYEAYDMMLYIGRSIHKYGKDFQFKVKKENEKYLQTSFDIQPKFKDDAFDKIDFFENKHLTIVEFKRGRFQRMN